MKYLLAIDLETTGLEIGYNEIVEVGALLLDGDGWIRNPEPFHMFAHPVYPERGIREGFNVWEYTGLSSEQLKTAPPLYQVLNLLRKYVEECIDVEDTTQHVSLYSQNSHFDMGFLRKAYQSCGLDFPFDYHTLDLPSMYTVWHLQTNGTLPDKPKQELIARQLEIPENENPHSAVHDMMQSVMILQRLLCEFRS